MPDLPGAGLQQLGQGLMQLGAGLGRIRPRQEQVDNTILQAAQLDELVRAKDIAYTTINAFNSRLHPLVQDSIPAEKMLQTWTETRKNILDEVSGIFTFPIARAKFEDWAIKEFSDQEIKVRNTAQDRFADQTTNRWYESIDKLVESGNPNEAESLIDDGANILLDAKGIQSLKDNVLPRARFNEAKVDLFGLPIEQSMGLVQELNWGDQWGLDEGQQDKLKKIIEARHQELQSQAEGQSYQAFNDLTRNLTAEQLIELPREELTKYTDPAGPFYVGDDREDEVEGYIKQYDKMIADGATAAKKLDQSTNYATMSINLYSWDGEGSAPWKPSDIKTLVRNEIITEAQGDKLIADYQKVEEQISKGERTPQRIQQNRNNSDFIGDMYVAMDSLKDPRAAVTINDLDESRRYGKINYAQYNDLISMRDRLGKEYDGRVADSKTKNGPLFENPFRVAELQAIILDDKLDPTEKLKRARPYKFNGVPGDKWHQIVGWLDEYSGDPNKSKVIKDINSLYSAIYADPGFNESDRKQKALEKSAVVDQMFNLFRQFPDNPEKWNEGLQPVLEPIKARQLHLMLQKR
ncbi:MAG: hypothetical protein ABIJ86_08585, partial [Spirochaetota bacterium]